MGHSIPADASGDSPLKNQKICRLAGQFFPKGDPETEIPQQNKKLKLEVDAVSRELLSAQFPPDKEQRRNLGFSSATPAR